MRRVSVLCGALAFIAACTNLDTPTNVDFELPNTDANVIGTFQLRSANGLIPPYVVTANSAGTQTLLNDRIILGANLTWVDTTTYEIDLATGDTQVGPTATSGTYNIASGKINFTMTTGGNATFQGAVVADTLKVSFQGRPFIYQR
ncbi:MAG TPA: hypothetical protein VGM82_20990 [Gemmatimonadaceae bacterium]|jgi:hypothetical protein